MSRRRQRRSQSGYALLVILFLGAVMAILMLMSLPRAAFESQRGKEDDLIYRGSQYSRAVQLFFRKNKRYPASMDDLEKFNNVRYLRRKYVDPITKKEEWRIIHVGPGGVFTDSLIYDRPKPKKEGEPDSGTPAGSTVASAPGAGAPGSPFDPNQPQITGMADRLRAHPGGAPADGTNPDGSTPTGPTYYNVGQPGAPLAGPTQNSGNFGGSGPPSPFGTPAGPGTNTPFGAPGTAPGSGTPFQPSYPGGPIPGNPGTMPGGANSPFGAGSEAARIIGQILTTPRPGGLNGIPGTGTVSAFGGNTGFGGNSAFGGNTGFGGNGAFGGGGAFGQPNQPGAFGQPNQAGAFGQPAGMGAFGGGNSGGAFGGGIAGVASKSEARGIKEYKDHEKYNEWEFVYDYRKDPVLMGGAAAMAGGAGMMPGQPGAMSGATATSAFGQQGQSPFGGGAFGGGGLGQPGAFGQPGVGPNGQPITPINPGQPGLPSSPFGPPRSGAPTQQQQ